MNEQSDAGSNEEKIRRILQQWATATRNGKRDTVLVNHHPNVLIYDVLSPMKYEGADAYRRSWDEWQPETQGEGQFELEDLSVTAGTDVAFATASSGAAARCQTARRSKTWCGVHSACARFQGPGWSRINTSQSRLRSPARSPKSGHSIAVAT